MANQNHKGLKRIVNAFGYSVQGFRACFRHEEAFRQELYATLLLPLGIWGSAPTAWSGHCWRAACCWCR